MSDLKTSLLWSGLSENGKQIIAKYDWPYVLRRILNWVPVGIAYGSCYFGRYNLNVSASAGVITNDQFGMIFFWGSLIYALTFLYSGPFTDKFGGRKSMLIGLFGTMVANLLMGLVLFKNSQGYALPVAPLFTVLFCANMACQSFCAASVVVVNAPWFHCCERGKFGTFFGAAISLGVYFGFDWGYAIMSATSAHADVNALHGMASFFQNLFGSGQGAVNESWWLFFAPACLMAACLIVLCFSLRNGPEQAGYKSFPTGREDDKKPLTAFGVYKYIVTHRVFSVVMALAICTGIMRNAALQWYPKFAEAIGFKHDFWISQNWGLTMLLTGIIGNLLTGWASDKFFRGRRGPMLAVVYAMATVGVITLTFTLSAPVWVGGIAVLVLFVAVFGGHSNMASVITADFSTKNTGAAVGLTDGLVYLGMGIQSLLITQVVPEKTDPAIHNPENWVWWPAMLILPAIIGLILAYRLRNEKPKSAGH